MSGHIEADILTEMSEFDEGLGENHSKQKEEKNLKFVSQEQRGGGGGWKEGGRRREVGSRPRGQGQMLRSLTGHDKDICSQSRQLGSHWGF